MFRLTACVLLCALLTGYHTKEVGKKSLAVDGHDEAKRDVKQNEGEIAQDLESLDDEANEKTNLLTNGEAAQLTAEVNDETALVTAENDDEDIDDEDMDKRAASPWGGRRRRRRRRRRRSLLRIIRNVVRSVPVLTGVAALLAQANHILTNNEISKKLGSEALKWKEYNDCMNSDNKDKLKKCTNDAVAGIKAGVFKMGGKGTGCLSIGGTDTFTHQMAPLTATTTVEQDAGVSIEYYIKTGKMTLGFYGSIKIFPEMKIDLSSSTTLKKTMPLSPLAITVFKTLIMAGPVPILIHIKMQPVIRMEVTTVSSGAGDLTLSIKDGIQISLDDLSVGYDPQTGPSVVVKTSSNLGSLNLEKKLTLEGSTNLKGTFALGPRFTISINGFPIHVLPSIQFQVDGTLHGGLSDSGAFCLGGSLQSTTNLVCYVTPDVANGASGDALVGAICEMGNMVTKALTPGKTEECTKLAFGVDHPATVMNNGCKKIVAELAKLPKLVHKNPVEIMMSLGSSVSAPMNFAECQAGDEVQANDDDNDEDDEDRLGEVLDEVTAAVGNLKDEIQEIKKRTSN